MLGLGAAGHEEGTGTGSGACVLTGALSPQAAEHAVPPAQGRQRGRPAALAVPLALLLAGPGGTGGGAARGGREPGPAALVGAPRAAGPAAAARAGAGGRAEDEDGAEAALQGLLHRAAARAALRVLQEQPPAQTAQGVAPGPRGCRAALACLTRCPVPAPVPGLPPGAGSRGHGSQSGVTVIRLNAHPERGAILTALAGTSAVDAENGVGNNSLHHLLSSYCEALKSPRC